eukprot:TRINITY_DN100_c0_g2_i1.p1 TRINITY_DN100_c0_g2~~TRINITY_DN100_c0_g2_i1.p1  ORF type:complete len:244 (+),score=22.85 TRINITY_DN100_c0_g2_i1:3353-4084(+)
MANKQWLPWILLSYLITISTATVINTSQNTSFPSVPMAYGADITFGTTDTMVGCGSIYSYFSMDEDDLDVLISEYQSQTEACYVVVHYNDVYLTPNKYFSRIFRIFESVPHLSGFIYGSPEQDAAMGGTMYTVDIDLKIHQIDVPIVQLSSTDFDAFIANYTSDDRVIFDDDGVNQWYYYRNHWPVYFWQVSLIIPVIALLILSIRFYMNSPSCVINTANVINIVTIVYCTIYLFQFLVRAGN